MGLSHAQAVEVAKRLHPSPGRVLWFAEDGSLLSGSESQHAVAAQRGEVYACRRLDARMAVEVARVDVDHLRAGVEPAFGVPW